MTKKRWIILAVLLIIAISLPLTVFIAQQQQETRQRASEGDLIGDTGGGIIGGNGSTSGFFFSRGDNCTTPITAYEGSVGQQDILSLCVNNSTSIAGFNITVPLATALGITNATFQEGSGAQVMENTIKKQETNGTIEFSKALSFAQYAAGVGPGVPLQIAKATFTINAAGSGTIATSVNQVFGSISQSGNPEAAQTLAGASFTYTVGSTTSPTAVPYGPCETSSYCATNPSTPYCDPQAKQCVECLTDANCPSGKVCNGSRSCAPAPAPTEGIGGNPQPLPTCDLSFGTVTPKTPEYLGDGTGQVKFTWNPPNAAQGNLYRYEFIITQSTTADNDISCGINATCDLNVTGTERKIALNPGVTYKWWTYAILNGNGVTCRTYQAQQTYGVPQCPASCPVANSGNERNDKVEQTCSDATKNVCTWKTCSTTSQCGNGFFCDSVHCVQKRENDGYCGSNTECVSNYCNTANNTCANATSPNPTGTSILAADVNKNGCVNIYDYNLWKNKYTVIPAIVVPAANDYTNGSIQNRITYPDINNDHVINLIDYNLWYTTLQTLPANDPRRCSDPGQLQ